jgi:2-keto-4-pentenoate hydratase
MTTQDAYAIEMRSLKDRTDNGEKAVGWKIGLCSKAVQQAFGFDAPIYGYLLDTMVAPEGEPIPIDRLFSPMIEGEICFVLKDDLKGPGVDVAKVLAATAGVMPAIEIPDSRFEGKKKIENMISDNTGAARVALGGQLTPVAEIDLRLVGMAMERNGEVVATGAGAAVLGNPALPVARLANKFAEYGMGLSAGDFIMSGSLIAPVPAEAGDLFRATFDRLGFVNAFFTD